MKQVLILLFSGILMMPLSTVAAVILQYHHVSSETPSVTSISPEDFRKHMQYLKDEGFHVVALPGLIDKIRNKEAVADKTVAITFDDGYESVYRHARPVLKSFGWPYTIFVNPKFVDSGYHRHMTWSQLNEVAKEGATIANHSMDHPYMIRTPKGETPTSWHDKMIEQIEQAEARIVKMTGQDEKMLAYPYGEFDSQMQIRLKKDGFVAFGQHSGAVGETTDLTRIPRFPASGIYASLDTLKVKLASLPFSVKSLKNSDMPITDNPPTLTVTLTVKDFNPKTLQCFSTGAGNAIVQWTTADSFTVKASKPLDSGRSRYNCTAPSISRPNRFYWFSQPWLNLGE